MLDFLKNLKFRNPLANNQRDAVKRIALSDDEVVVDCLKALSCQDGGLGLFRLVHLLEAVGSIPEIPSKIISIGSGKGYHEVLLAKLFPHSQIVAIDIEKQNHAHQVGNLIGMQGDILSSKFMSKVEKADFVYSIECLEHIEKDAAAFAAMASMTRSGGFFYLQVPYATDWERNDKETIQREFSMFGHCTPGYDGAQLQKLATDCSLNVKLIRNVFWTPLQPMLWAAVEKFGPEIIHRYTVELIDLLMTDFRDEPANHRGQSTGIKMLTLQP